MFVALRLLLVAVGGAGRAACRSSASPRSAASLAALLYFAISGGNVAALRSTVMIVLVFGAVIVGRRALTMRNVAIAALVVIAQRSGERVPPELPALVRRGGRADRRLGAGARRARAASATSCSRRCGYFGGIAVTSLVAGAATLLFSVYHFQQTSPLGVLGNLASLPLVGFVMMPSAVLAVLAMPFGFEGPFLAAMGWSIDRMLDLARLVAGLERRVSTRARC